MSANVLENPVDNAANNAEGDSAACSTEMLLLFSLSNELFGIEVACVSEILDPVQRTEVPNANSFCPAVVNVRGAIVPLIDIRQRLKMRLQPPGDDTRIVVLDVSVEGQMTKIALVADAVTHVIEADLGALEPIPELGARWPKKYVKGVARNGEDLVVLLDTETLFRAEQPELNELQETSS